MTSSPLSHSSSDVENQLSSGQTLPEATPAERRSLRTTEAIYAVFMLAVAFLLFATAV